MERTRIHVGTSWQGRERTLPVVAPWSGETLAAGSLADREDLEAALTTAHGALSRPLPRAERAAVLDRVADELAETREALARTIALEVAKPITAARAEVDRAVQTIRFSAVEARQLGGDVVPLDAHPSGGSGHAFTVLEPRGVLAAITPFNFPLNLVAHKVGPAVAADCPVVLKPAERSPLSAIRLVEAFLAAGLPPERLQLVTGLGPELVPPLVADDRVAVVSFTGSAPVGRSLEQLAPHKPVLLELGSAAPLVVEADGDLERAVGAVLAHGFGHAGQSCVSVQRVIVHESCRDELVSLLADGVARLRLGDPLDEASDLSCVIDDGAADRIARSIADAVGAGGHLLSGGEREGRSLQPTVVADPPRASSLWAEEIFGPVVAVRSFGGTDEAVALVNDGAPVINAGVFTRDLDRALHYVRHLRAGTVLVNESPTYRVDHMPYGGTGAAGNTREGPGATVRELTTEKLVVLRGAG